MVSFFESWQSRSWFHYIKEIDQDILHKFTFCVIRKKESHSGLEQHKNFGCTIPFKCKEMILFTKLILDRAGLLLD